MWQQFILSQRPPTGGVGRDSQSLPGEIFARAHFHLIAEGQTSPRANSIGGSLAFDGERILE